MDKTVLIVCEKTFLLEMTQKKVHIEKNTSKINSTDTFFHFFSPFLVCLLDISVLNSKIL